MKLLPFYHWVAVWVSQSNTDLRLSDSRFKCSLVGLFLLGTIAFWTGHSVGRYVRSLAPLTPLTRSAALRFATLASLARSVHGLAHSLRSLPRGTVVIHESVFTLKSFFSGTIDILVVSRNRPLVVEISWETGSKVRRRVGGCIWFQGANSPDVRKVAAFLNLSESF